jgi:hypothetical protein
VLGQSIKERRINAFRAAFRLILLLGLFGLLGLLRQLSDPANLGVHPKTAKPASPASSQIGDGNPHCRNLFQGIFQFFQVNSVRKSRVPNPSRNLLLLDIFLVAVCADRVVSEHP